MKCLTRFFILMIVLAIFGFLPLNADAANWYVDRDATGQNNGKSWADAWQSFSRVVWGSTGVTAGDTLYISGGSTSKVYTESWSVGASGATGNPITIRVDAGNPNHNGIVTFDYNSMGDSGSGQAIFCDKSHIVFDGNVNGERHILIRNLRNILNRSTAYAIVGWSNNNIVIRYLEIQNCNNGIKFSSTNDSIQINDNKIQVRGDAAITIFGSAITWNANLIHDNYIETLFNTEKPSGATYSYGGPDGIQCGSGFSIYNNVFRVTKTSSYTSDQHPDQVQLAGNYNKIYNNKFINVGDSSIDFDCWANSTPHDIWIFGNTFSITDSIDSYPEYFRLYSSSNQILSLTNFKIMNNTFVDNDTWSCVKFYGYQGNPSASGMEIKNNIFYNCGNGAYKPVILVESSTSFTADSFSIDGNAYYHSNNDAYVTFRGTPYTAASWVSSHEERGKIGMPFFVRYNKFSADNDLRLLRSDVVALDAGLSLSNYFSTDQYNTTRPQGDGWDIGAFETAIDSQISPPSNLRTN